MQSPSEHPWLEPLLAQVCPGAEWPILTVDPRDEMLAQALERHFDADLATLEYFSSGAQVTSLLGQVAQWRFGGWNAVGSFLDFGGGYGRVTRFLRRELGPGRVTVAEILEGALHFQAETLGVATVPSAPTPDSCSPGTHDFVYAGSLFTHLPEARFGPWLHRLLDAVAPGGVLAFTVHGPSLMPPHVGEPRPSGITFFPSSESRTLDVHDYGSTWVTETFVARLVREAAPEARARCIPRGLCNHQDLWIVCRDGDDPAGMPFDAGVQGQVELCTIDAGEIRMAGWALDRSPGFEPAELRAVLGGETVARQSELYARPDLAEHLHELGLPGHGEGLDAYLHSGFDLSFRLPSDVRRGSVPLFLLARSSGGATSVLFAGCLESALYLAARENHHRKKDEVLALETTLSNMRRSRFWRIRDRWFAVKRALRLTTQP